MTWKEIQGFPVGPRNGRTQFMIDMITDAVIEGCPHILVVGHSEDFVRRNLFPRIREALLARNLMPSLVLNRVQGYPCRIAVDGTTIDFATDLSNRNKSLIPQGCSTYVDHFAAGED